MYHSDIMIRDSNAKDVAGFMAFSENVRNELSSFLYTLESATHFQAKTCLEQKPFLHGFILLKEPNGQMTIDGTSHSIYHDSIFFIHAHSHKHQLIQFQQPLEGYHVQFHALTTKGHGKYESTYLPCPQMFSTTQPFNLQSKIQEIINQQNQDPMMANISFQTWIHTLLNEIETEQSLPIKKLINQSREYMNTHYQSEITREQLAQMTGLHVDYYSRKFKQLYHKSPIAYLNEVRLRQAKQWLLQSNEPIRSIAKKVGFSDEFYFSRKFKAKEGKSPSIYINKLRESNRMASLNHLVTGHSMAIGSEPYAALRNQSFPITYNLSNMISIGDHQPNLDKLLDVKPDFIVRCAPEDHTHTTKDDVYQQIAPTVTLSYQDTWQKNLDMIARLLQKEKEATHFLETYHSKAERLQKCVKQRMGSATLLIVGIGEHSLCVYGSRNLGSVLYHDLNISMPMGVEQIYHLKEISIHELTEMNPDHILLTIYRDKHRLPSKHVLQKQLQQLQQHPDWNSLRAVQRNRVYSILDSNHLYTSYNAYSNHLFLDKMKQLLGADIG